MSRWSQPRTVLSTSATTRYSEVLPSSQSKSAHEDTTLQLGATAKASLLSEVSAQDHASQHTGDRFYAPVTFQHAATAHVAQDSGGEDEYVAFLQSLAFDEMGSRYMAIHPHLPGTCEWLLAAPEYNIWKDAELMSVHNGFLWIKGKAGAGKSTLMKFASGRAEASCVEGEYVLTFFFNARGGPLEVSTDGLFRSLLRQILEKVPRLYSRLDKRRLNFSKRQGWSPALLKDLFRDAVMSLGQNRVACYIDAMDECVDEDVKDIIQFFDDLGDVVVAQALSFRVCMSSRHYSNFRLSKNVEVALEHQRGHDRDIQAYLQRRLVVGKKKLKKALMESITAKAMGVFLWVVLVVALVNRDDRRGIAQDIYKHFDLVPRRLSDLFADLIERSAHHEHFRPLLQWVTFCRYPLDPRSLYCALMHTAESAPQRNGRSLSLDPKNVAKFILDSSKGLVEITPDDRVQFIHESLRTYFLGEGVGYLTGGTVAKVLADEGSEEARAQRMAVVTAHCHDQLKERCLDYLAQIFPLLDSTPRSSELSHLEGRIATSFPFLHYALDGVLSHANTAQNLGAQQQEFLNTLPWDKIGLLCQISRAPFSEDEWECASSAPWYKAYLTAKLGYHGLLKSILKTLPRSEVESSQWGAILRTSMETLNAPGVSTMLEAGADPNALWRDGKPCLWHAIGAATSMDHPDCFSLSGHDHCICESDLSSPIDVNGDGSDQDQANAFEIVRIFRRHGAKPYATRVNTYDCIYQACQTKKWRFLRVLFGECMKGEHVETDTQSPDYAVSLASALGNASMLSNDGIMFFLVRKGAEVALWSHGTVKTQTAGRASLQVTFKEESTVRRILAEGAQVLSPAAIEEECGGSFQRDSHVERPRRLSDLRRQDTGLFVNESPIVCAAFDGDSPLSCAEDVVVDLTLHFKLRTWPIYTPIDRTSSTERSSRASRQHRGNTLLWMIWDDYLQDGSASARRAVQTTKKMLVELNGLPRRLSLFCFWLLTATLAKVSAYIAMQTGIDHGQRNDQGITLNTH